MLMQDEKTGEPTEEQLLAHALRPIFEFIIREMQGDRAAASVLFQRYLAGELPEELLSLSRRCVEQDQEGRRTQPHEMKNRLEAPERGAAFTVRQRPGTSPARYDGSARAAARAPRAALASGRPPRRRAG